MKNHLKIVIAMLIVASVGFAQSAKAAKHKVTPAQAIKIALKKQSGKVIKSPHLEHEDGAWQYEVLVQSGKNMWEINVNADTGKIGSVEKTSAKEEARESKESKKSKD